MNLDPFSPEILDGKNSRIISYKSNQPMPSRILTSVPTREESQSSDNQIAQRKATELVPCSASYPLETNTLEHDRLIEIDSVKGYIDKEPASGGTNEDFEMAPLAEVGNEF